MAENHNDEEQSKKDSEQSDKNPEDGIISAIAKQIEKKSGPAGPYLTILILALGGGYQYFDKFGQLDDKIKDFEIKVIKSNKTIDELREQAQSKIDSAVNNIESEEKELKALHENALSQIRHMDSVVKAFINSQDIVLSDTVR